MSTAPSFSEAALTLPVTPPTQKQERWGELPPGAGSSSGVAGVQDAGVVGLALGQPLPSHDPVMVI